MERDKSDFVIQLENAQKELDDRQAKWDELQARFNTEIDNLVASKSRRNEIAQEVQSLSEDKERLNHDISKAQENLTAAQMKIENLQQQINELNEKNSSEMVKMTDENTKLLEKNKELEQEVESIREENKTHSEAIDVKSKEIEKYKEQLAIFESNELGVTISKLKYAFINSYNSYLLMNCYLYYFNVVYLFYFYFRSELETCQNENKQILEDSKNLKELCDKYKADVNENNRQYYELKTATEKERDENTVRIY